MRLHMINTTNLYYFIIAAEELNITKAAERLYITQQTLSGQIQKLEKQYDAVFFERKPRLKLTPQGEKMLEFAKQAVDAENRLIRDLDTSRMQMTLRIGNSSSRGTAVLDKVLQQYNDLHPEIEFAIVSSSAANLRIMLINGDIDAYTASGIHCPDTFSFETLSETKFYYVCNKKLLGKYCDISSLIKMENDEKIKIISKVPMSCPPEKYPLHDTIINYFLNHGLSPNIKAESSTAPESLALCQSRIAGTLLPAETIALNINALSQKDTILIPMKDFVEMEPLGIVYSQKAIKLHIEDYIRLFRENLLIKVNESEKNIEKYLK